MSRSIPRPSEPEPEEPVAHVIDLGFDYLERYKYEPDEDHMRVDEQGYDRLTT